MDTPVRNQIGTPLSKFEESPFSNFINNLSPINLTKSIHVSHTFGSLSFTSPPSVFTSPHVSLQKDAKFLRRHQLSELAKSAFASDQGSKDFSARDITNANKQSNNLQQGESSSKPLENLPRVHAYDTQSESNTSLALVPFVQDHPSRTLFRTELNPQDTNPNNEETECDWQSLIACSSDLFIFDSPDVNSGSKQSTQKSQEEEGNVFACLIPRFPFDEEFDLQNSLHVGSSNYNEEHESTDHLRQPVEESELEVIDQPLENQDVDEFLPSDTEPRKEACGNLHRGLRRRCLTFEMPRTKTNIEGVTFSRSLLSSSQTEEKQLPCNRQSITPKSDSLRCILPGIGLHLNALTASSIERGSSEKGILTPNPLINSLALSSLSKDVGQVDNVLDSIEDSSQASLYASNEELNPNSPKKKRKKPENAGEGESCKRCNCKKSKCLKLYCECFAAGIYCVEPCSCQDCFNKPIHEDVVLATRKQIESRNPLAFAPKVIRTTDSAQELGEDSNQTPASARHKRGCNCKKSNCLKKYCECYQGGVGCSINCRCEGCKNAFGRKDGSILIVAESEMDKLQTSDKTMMDKPSDISGFQDDEDQNSEFAIPKTPSRLYRSSVPMATSFKRKLPRSSLGMTNPTSDLISIDKARRPTLLRSQSRIEKHYENTSNDEIPALLQNMSPPNNGLKTLSPNTKRISPPHHVNAQNIPLRSSRKLILQSIPSFPSLSPRR